MQVAVSYLKILCDVDPTSSFGVIGLSVMLRNIRKSQAITKRMKFPIHFFYLRHCFIITHMNIQRDEDGLLPNSRGLLKLHKYVRVPKYSWRDTMKTKTIYEFWHGDCVETALSEK